MIVWQSGGWCGVCRVYHRVGPWPVSHQRRLAAFNRAVARRVAREARP